MTKRERIEMACRLMREIRNEIRHIDFLMYEVEELVTDGHKEGITDDWYKVLEETDYICLYGNLEEYMKKLTDSLGEEDKGESE